ncbi:MAG: TonB-dependent receptor [Rhodothermales bacterium]|nr:TonB-dependent receptor [Rhodothermales bacterium]
MPAPEDLSQAILRIVSIALAVGTLVTNSVRAQDATSSPDSLRSYALEEIVVVDVPRGERAPNTLQRLPLAGIALADASSADEIIRLIPAAHVQTNSRGESHVYLRGARERQVAVFFDGALLNVPWDSRFDLSLVPANVIGEIVVSKGAVSVLHGANAIGGTVDLKPRKVSRRGQLSELEIAGGSAGLVQGRLTQLSRASGVEYGLSAGYSRRAGLTLPTDHNLAFNQLRNDRRTNTDRSLMDVFGRVTHRLGNGGRIGLTLMHVDAEQGVAPEGHLDPDQSRVRYWRYPYRRNSMAIIGTDVPLGDRGAHVRGAIWLGRFAQGIQQYESAAYASLVDRQDDKDRTAGARFILHQPVRIGTIRLALNLLTSRHVQTDYALDPTGSLRPDAADLRFGQHIWSLGAEYEWRPPGRLMWQLGGSLDGSATPVTGDKPARNPEMAVSLTAGLRYAFDERTALRLSAGRKTRFPTMRELFGEALGRFLLNPELTAESRVMVEAGFEIRTRRFEGESVVFFERSYDTIDQRFVLLPDEAQARRQRINRAGGRSVGVEMVGRGRLAAGLTLAGHVTWVRAQTVDAGATVQAIETPEWLGIGTLRYNSRSGFSLLLQTLYTGRAYGIDDSNSLVPLATSVAFNVRAGYRLTSGRVVTEVFGRVDNVTDVLTLPQPGLPGPGRTFRFGLDLSLPGRKSGV